jgi:uncharacterized protein (UPF0276 family)
MADDAPVSVPDPWPRLGCGMGLRREHYEFVLEERPPVEWFEVVTENYLDTGGRPLAVLDAVRRDYPVGLHGVALSIGSTDPLDARYLERLAALVERVEPALVTDHLCWAGVDGRSLYDLLPVPYTEEALAHVSERVARVQDRLGRRILLENPSTYIEYRCSQMPEWELLAARAARADCGILLDVNNVFVTCSNHGHDPVRYLEGIPPARVGQFHLGGFTDLGTFLFDTHGTHVSPEVWGLFETAARRFGRVTTLVEWDAAIPPFTTVQAEVAQARAVLEKVHGRAVAA